MEMTTKMKKQRRFMLVLPLLVLPFVTMFFWALGGGRIKQAPAPASKRGLNFELPDANVNGVDAKSKMDYYNQASIDSAKFRELMRNDPAFQHSQNTDLYAGYSDGGTTAGGSMNYSLQGSGYNDPHTSAIYDRLNAVNRSLNQAGAPGWGTDEMYNAAAGRERPDLDRSEVDRLEQMMTAFNQPNGPDPEMDQINGMLQNILDIQHPDRVEERLKAKSNKHRGKVYSVISPIKKNTVSLLDSARIVESEGFFGIPQSTPDSLENSVRAVVQDNQIVVNGSTVKLRLTSDIFVNGVMIPRNNFIFGVASLAGERLTIKISDIRYKDALFPVELSVYDLDGLDGIYVPGAISRDVAKESADRTMQSIGFSSLDPSVAAQAASAGIAAVKSLVGRKVKLVKVVLMAGYQVLLRDEKE